MTGEVALTRILYELCGTDTSRPFSPFCWRSRMALLHKGLEFETAPRPFTEIAAIAPDAGKTVPLLVDGARTICDSWAIAEYLEDTYPDQPSLFGGAGGRAAAKFIDSWANASVSALIVRLIVKDIHDILAPADQAYFRETRESRFGQTLEEVQHDREARVAEVAKALMPMNIMLRSQPFIGGNTPLYGDYSLFGTLQWARVSSPLTLLEADTPVAEWFERCLDLFNGAARKTPAAV